MQVTSASQAAARDAAAIRARGGSFPLMAAAGTVAAASIMRLAEVSLARGVDVFVGGGNNGGDGYVVAAQLARLGVRVRVHAVVPPQSADCVHAEAMARAVLPTPNVLALPTDAAAFVPAGGVVVDALLGTGATGPLRPAIAAGVAHINRARTRGAVVVALDVPTGVDATTGALADDFVSAQLTLVFGTLKSGLLNARAACGLVQLLDIGLGEFAEAGDGAPQLATGNALRRVVPDIAWDAHKGTRGRVLIVGATPGMAGAVQLAAHGALLSGAGLVRAAVHEQSVAPLQTSVPAVVTMPWGPDVHVLDEALDESLAIHVEDTSASPPNDLVHAASRWAHAVAIGPGLGRDVQAWRLLSQLLRCVKTGDAAMVLDADAIWLLAERGVPPAFAACAASRPVVLTPHAGEFAALAHRLGVPFDRARRDPSARLESVRALAARLGCTILLKGTPTLCVSASGTAWCVPRGSSALATGGTGDVLTGVLAAVLAAERARGDAKGLGPQEVSADARTAAQAAACAWVHGVAGEFGNESSAIGTSSGTPSRAANGVRASIRGRTVMDVLQALPHAWTRWQQPEALAPAVLAELPALSL